MDNSNKAMNNIGDFVEQIIDEQGYSTLDADAKEILKGEMVQRLMDQIDRAAIDALPEEKAIELADKMDDMTEDEIAEFMQNSGVNLQEVALTTMLQFKMLYVGGGEEA